MLKIKPVGGVSKIKKLSLDEESKKRRKEVEVGIIIPFKLINFLTKIAF